MGVAFLSKCLTSQRAAEADLEAPGLRTPDVQERQHTGSGEAPAASSA